MSGVSREQSGLEEVFRWEDADGVQREFACTSRRFEIREARRAGRKYRVLCEGRWASVERVEVRRRGIFRAVVLHTADEVIHLADRVPPEDAESLQAACDTHFGREVSLVPSARRVLRPSSEPPPVARGWHPPRPRLANARRPGPREGAPPSSERLQAQAHSSGGPRMGSRTPRTEVWLVDRTLDSETFMVPRPDPPDVAFAPYVGAGLGIAVGIVLVGCALEALVAPPLGVVAGLVTLATLGIAGLAALGVATLGLVRSGRAMREVDHEVSTSMHGIQVGKQLIRWADVRDILTPRDERLGPFAWPQSAVQLDTPEGAVPVTGPLHLNDATRLRARLLARRPEPADEEKAVPDTLAAVRNAAASKS